MPAPRVFRRTPTSEKAAIYGYKDLLKDSLSLLQSRASANVARMTSGGLSDEELLEIGLAPAGGMLKVAGTSRLLAGLLARQRKAFFKAKGLAKVTSLSEEDILKSFAPGQRAFKEALKVPEKEYGRIRDIKWSSMRGEAPGTKGIYDPSTKEIGLHPGLSDVATIWHEFTHARQWTPEKEERAAAGVLRFLNEELARKSGLSGWKDFYYNISPIEEHARSVGMSMATRGKPSAFSRVYKGLLKSALIGGEERVGPKLTKDFWDIVLRTRGK